MPHQVLFSFVCLKEGDRILKLTKTPCIGVCSTGIGGDVCRGCKRYSHEVIHWNGYSDAVQQTVFRRLQMLLAQVVKSKVSVVDANRLRAFMVDQRIKTYSLDNAYCWVFDLLKSGAAQLQPRALEALGVQILPQWRGRPLTVLRDAMDEDFYTLSVVHYERYFQAANVHLAEMST